MNLQKTLDKAKIGVMLQGSVFISTVAFSLKHSFREDIATAGTDGKNIFYNPTFWESLNPNQRISLIAHEAWHVALLHITRRGERDPMLYNVAGDYVINQLLVDDGFELPDGGLQDSKYRGWSTNQVYDALEKDNPPENPMDGDIIYVGSPEGNEDEVEGGKGNSTDSQKIEQQTKEIEAQVKEILVKATTQSKMHGEQAGSVPSEISRELDKLINPRLPWETLLERFLNEKVKNDYSWTRPNKRYAPDFYLPTQYSEALEHICVAIDTSGSINNEDLIKILTELQYIRDTFKPEKMTIIDCDCQINHVYDVTPDTHVLDLEFTGGGGTSCFPVFKHLEKNPTKALIYFTDLYMQQYNKQVDFPVLWVVYDNPNAQVEVGDIIHYDL